MRGLFESVAVDYRSGHLVFEPRSGGGSSIFVVRPKRAEGRHGNPVYEEQPYLVAGHSSWCPSTANPGECDLSHVPVGAGSSNFAARCRTRRTLREIMMKVFLIAAVASLSGCATIISGTHQEVKINSIPTGAAVMVDGAPRGVTPVVLRLKRRPSHTLTLQKIGYQPQSCIINSGFNGWFLGNILLGGVIGMAVDGIDGASSKLEVPDDGYFTLVPNGSPTPPAPTTSTESHSGASVAQNH